VRALILAAGRGSRMGARTDALPKGLLELRGRSLIARQLDALRAAGAHETALVRGYRGECLDFGVRTFTNERWADTNMVSSLLCASEWLRAGPCVVSYADLVYPPEAPRRLFAAQDDVALLYDVNWRALWEQRFADPLDDAETLRIDGEGRVLEIGRRARDYARIQGQYMGLFRFSPRGAERFVERVQALAPAARDRLDMTSAFELCVQAGETIRAVPYDGWWCEVDSAGDLDVAERILERERQA
jgi:choline kinase